jgi:hypothetical protein
MKLLKRQMPQNILPPIGATRPKPAPKAPPLDSAGRERRPDPALLCYLILLMLTLASACTDPERLAIYNDSWNISSPVVLEQHIAYLDSTREQLIVLAANGSNLSTRHIPTGRDPQGVIASHDLKQLAVLSARDRAVTVINVESGQQRTYALGQSFDSLVFSDDSNRLLAYFSASASSVPRDELFNPNAYALIDLQAADPAQAVTKRALRSFGSAPLAVHWVPPFVLDDSGTQQQYALFLFNSYVTFADLNDPDFEVTVQLTLSATDPAVTPTRILFSDSEGAPDLQSTFVYLLTQQTNDVYTINLLPGSGPNGEVRLAPSINQLPSGQGPGDMVTFLGPDGREKLLVVNTYSQDVSLVDAATASVLHVRLEAAANRIYLYHAIDEQTGEEQPFALVYNNEGWNNVVSFIKLAQLQTRRQQAVSALSLRSPVSSLFASSVDGQAVVVHASGQGLSIVDLAGQFANPLQANAALEDIEHDFGNQRLFATINGSKVLNMVDLARSQPSSVGLDYIVDDLIWLPKANSLLALHGDQAGLITAMEVGVGETPSREKAKIHAGFFLSGLFDAE